MLTLRDCRAAGVILLFMLICGCSQSHAPALAPSSYFHPELAGHAILVNEGGLPCDPLTFHPYDRHPGQTGAYEQQLQQMLMSLERFFNDDKRSKGPRKILIFVHGGMNTPTDSRNTASIALREMLAHNSDYYPFFLNWNSGPFSSLGEHLSNPIITDGDADYIISPIAYLAADFGRAIARAPIVLARMGQNDWDATSGAIASFENFKDQSAVWQNFHLRDSLLFYYALNQRYRDHPADQIAVSVGDVHVDDMEWVRRVAQYAAALPAKLVSTPLLDALGQGAYEKMLRRARAMFANPENALQATVTLSQLERQLDYGQSGAIPLFLDALRAYVRDHQQPDRPFEITLMGHSMGAIIVNRIVDLYPDLPTSHIVFLGAACTIDDFRTSSIPYLRSHPNTDFHNLSLHPTAEAMDDEATDLVTRGSLLIWIDKFLDEPQTPLNRTMGQWSNIVAATYIFPREMRHRITLKAFGLVDPGRITTDNPQVHSALGRIPFWDPAIWQAGPAREEEDALMQRAVSLLSRPPTGASSSAGDP